MTESIREAQLKRTDAGLMGPKVIGSSSTRATSRGSEARSGGTTRTEKEARLGLSSASASRVSSPGQRNGMYHRERSQETTLLLPGSAAVLVIESEERRLKAWDFVHCPPWLRRVLRRRR